MNLKHYVGILSLLLITTVGCYQNPNRLPPRRQVGAPPVPGPTGPNGKDGVDGKSQYYPAGVALDMINEVDVYLTQEGLTIHSVDTTKRPNLPGAFDEAPTCTPNTRIGNKAFVGIHSTKDGSLSGTKVADLKYIKFEARRDDGVSSSYFNLLVDCNGDDQWDATNDTIVTVSPFPSLTFDLNNGVFSVVTISAQDPVFRSVGARCGLGSHIPPTPPGTDNGKPLSALLAGNPNAKLISIVPKDCGMPLNTKMSPVLYIQGDSNANQVLRTTLKEISIGIRDKEYSYKFGVN